jgi:hypothetical protein
VVGGNTTSFLMFAMIAGYLFLKRPGTVARTWRHPVFLVAFALLVLGALIESAHPESKYSDIVRFGQMIMAAICVASLCRDRRALRTSIYSYLIAGVLMSLLLFFAGYGALQNTDATDFKEGTRIRGKVYTDIQGNLNQLAVFPAQGAVVALALGLTARSPQRRYLFLGPALFCVIGTFLTMSRSGMVIVGVSCTTVMFVYGVRHIRVILIAAVLAVGALIWVPEAVFSRLTFTPEMGAGKMEIRARLYKAALDHLPEYILTGVGAGNFWGPWGQQTEYYYAGAVGGAHNGFIQVAIYWGAAALLTLFLVVYLAYRCLPRRGGKDVLALCLYGLAMSLFLRMMVVHAIGSKEYSLGLGLLVAAQLWIWPKGIVPVLRRGQSRHHPTLKHAL